MTGGNHEPGGRTCTLHYTIDLRRPWLSISFLPSIRQWYIPRRYGISLYYRNERLIRVPIPTYLYNFIQNANRGDLYLLLTSEAASVDK